MAKFMIAHLNDGLIGDARILQPETARLMRTRLSSPYSMAAGMLHGFSPLDWNGEKIYGHGWETVWFHSLTAMLPDRNLGVFVAFRALRPWVQKDVELFRAVSHGEFSVNGFRNRDLQALLFKGTPGSQKEKQRRSGSVSRLLRMLRAHHLIQKVPSTYRYVLTQKGSQIMTAGPDIATDHS
jgi:hypothetical protein